MRVRFLPIKDFDSRTNPAFSPTFVYNGRKERRCGWDEEMSGASARVSAFAWRDGERGGAARRLGGGLFHRQFGWNGFDAEPDACAEKGGLCVFLGELVRHEPRGAAGRSGDVRSIRRGLRLHRRQRGGGGHRFNR